MNIEQMTIGDAMKIVSLFTPIQTVVANQDAHWEIGKCYLIRTVTMIDTGRLVAVTDKELVLEDAAWIADTGRFADALQKAEYCEVEPFPEGRVIVGRGAVIDAVQICRVERTQK